MLISTYLPEGIGQRLIQLHPDPKAFWFGQFAHYLMRNNKMIDGLMIDEKCVKKDWITKTICRVNKIMNRESSSLCFNRKYKSQAYNCCPFFALKIGSNPHLELK